jgi:synaptic vesicle membrane protein VAT-1
MAGKRWGRSSCSPTPPTATSTGATCNDRFASYPDLPRIPVVPGYEVAGRVDIVGGGVDPSWVGRDVFALTRFGGYADVVCVPEAQVFVRPEGISAQEGASIPVNYLTARQLMIVMGGLKPNETVLIHSVGGGVGIAATQIAKHVGARVIGTARRSGDRLQDRGL